MAGPRDDPDATQATGLLGKRSVFLLVCRAVYAAGGVGAPERKLIKRLQKVFRLPPAVAKKLLAKAKRSTEAIEGEELSPREIFTRACEMAWVDGRLTDRERKILTALAATMKLGKRDAERILRETYEATLPETAKAAAPAPPKEPDPAPTAEPTPPEPPPTPEPLEAGGFSPAPASPPAAEAEPPPTDRRPMLLGLVAGLCLAILAGGGGAVWWIRAKIEAVSKGRRLVAAVLPKQGPACPADEAMQEALGAFRKLPYKEGLWGFGWGDKVKPTPDLDAARAALAESETLRRVMIERFGPGLEPPDQGVVLQRVHDFQHHRRLHNRLAEDFLSLVLLGRHDEALALAEVKERHARILGQGIANHPTLIARMIALGCTKSLDRAVQATLERELLPPEPRSRLAALYREAIEKDVSTDVSLRAEFEMGRRAVRAFDQELGLLQYPMRLWWGNGLETVDELERRLDAGEAAPGLDFFKDVHVALQITIPNYASARSRWKTALATREKLLDDMG